MENLKERYLKTEDNLVDAEKIFLVSSVVRDVVEKKYSGDISDEQCKNYFIFIEKFLKGEIDMFWDDGVIKVKKITNYDEQRRQALESLREAYKRIIGDPDVQE